MATICEEFETHQDGSGELDVLMGQSILRHDPASQPKGWIQGNMRIGPVLEVTTSFHTANMGLKFESGLWVKIVLNLGSEYLMERTNT